MKSFKFLEAQLTIQTDTRQLGKVVVPAEVEEEEEGGDDDDATSLASAHSSSQSPSGMQSSMSQAGPSEACDRRPKPATSTSTGKRVDEAILKLAEQLTVNTGVQDYLASAVQEGSNPHIAFCQWMGLEACKLTAELWVDRVHAGVLPDDSALQAAPGPAAGTSSSSACTASSSAATPGVSFRAPLKCTSSADTFQLPPANAPDSAVAA